tara:strand:+ start:82 stop:291 length:210 start_codon:yes stop_codon:yes gene_type:complete
MTNFFHTVFKNTYAHFISRLRVWLLASKVIFILKTASRKNKKAIKLPLPNSFVYFYIFQNNKWVFYNPD